MESRDGLYNLFFNGCPFFSSSSPFLSLLVALDLENGADLNLVEDFHSEALHPTPPVCHA